MTPTALPEEFEKQLDAVLAMPAPHGWAVNERVRALLETCNGNDRRQGMVIDAVFRNFPAYAADRSGVASDKLLRLVAAAAGIDILAFAGLAGRAPDGSAMFMSAPDGREGRIGFAVKKSSEAGTLFVKGIFKGTGEELLTWSKHAHNPWTQTRRHYREFVAAAQTALENPETAQALPLLAGAARARIVIARAAVPPAAEA